MSIYKFPEYYELLLNELYKKYSAEMKLTPEKLRKLRLTLNHTMGKGLDYNRERAMLYTIYFLPVNFFKSLQLLELFHKKTDIFSRESVSIADIGCGPGSFFSALVYFLNKNNLKPRIEYTGLDYSYYNLEIFKELFFTKDFKKFINFPLKFNTVEGDFLEYRKIKKKDIVWTSNVFSELMEEHDIFIKKICELMVKDSKSYAVFVEPVNRKKNRVFHKHTLDFVLNNPKYGEVLPCRTHGEIENCIKCDFFETAQFEPLKIWGDFRINKDDADYSFRILTNKHESVSKLPSLPVEEKSNSVIKGWLCVKNIYRKPKPPWRFKICEGESGINHIDILVDSEENYNILQNAHIGDMFEFHGDVSKDKAKGQKSKFVFEVKKIKY